MVEITVDKCFRIVKEDNTLLQLFPMLTKGTEFRVLKTEMNGATIIQVRNGPELDIAGYDIPYWCFWSDDNMDELEEIEESANTPIKKVRYPSLYQGKPIVSQLYSVAGQENNDGYEYDLMQAAADYIRELEKRLAFSDKAF